MQALPQALSYLAQWPQFITWAASPNPAKPGKLEKFPTHWRSGAVINAHAPDCWTTADQALAAVQGRGDRVGVGFVLTDADPFFFLDLDGAYDTGAGRWSDTANHLVARFPGAAVETSMSGVGLHVLGLTGKPLDHAKKNTPKGLELYTSGRFVALTGAQATGSLGPGMDHTRALLDVITEFFPPSPTGDWAGWTHEAVKGSTAIPDDAQLVARALASGARGALAAFGGNGSVTFADLWTADADKLAAKWAGKTNGYDASSADMALANMLAFWTGKNCERMRELMEASALKRDKWFVRPAYLADTITRACEFTKSVYTKKADTTLPPSGATLGPPGVVLEGMRDPMAEYMPPATQRDYFAGCHFDNSNDRVYSYPFNTVFSKTGFDVNYGGHVFVMDATGQKLSDSAWDAFTKSRVNLPSIVDALCFRPEIAAGVVVNDGGRRYVNSYVPYVPVVAEGDPAPFLAHLAKLLPDPTDRARILAYMAACAQNPGVKFQWWPVLQGVEGNGKTMIGEVMVYVMGAHYSHTLNSHAAARDGLKFNAWIYRKLLVVVEEIMLAKKRDFLDEFKTIVTNPRISVERKGVDAITFDNRANGFLFTNHKNGVPVTRDSRRYAIFYTAQQSVEDMARDGMSDAYFNDLWAWLKGTGKYATLGAGHGFGVMAGYLRTMAIPAELNPATSSRAPVTTSTAEALSQSWGTAEQEIIEATEEGRPGFAGGWISSRYVDSLLKELRVSVPRNKRREMLQSLGYEVHPALDGGRVNNPVFPDNGKPRLYVREGHAALSLTDPADVGRAYEKAQELSQRPSATVLPFTPKGTPTAAEAFGGGLPGPPNRLN